jgi:hypothetical protein
MASSKSRASSPSIVTVTTWRKSVRPSTSCSRTLVPMALACATASDECSSGMLYLRMMISLSTPGASISPSTSITRPSGPRAGVGHRVISTTTMFPAFGIQMIRRRNLDVHDETPVEGHDEAHARAVHVEAPHDRRGSAREDADDPPFGPVPGDPLEARDHPIAVHRLIQIAAGNVDVAGHLFQGLVRHHEPEPARMCDYPSDHEVHPGRHPEAAPPGFDESAVGDQVGENRWSGRPCRRPACQGAAASVGGWQGGRARRGRAGAPAHDST